MMHRTIGAALAAFTVGLAGALALAGPAQAQDGVMPDAPWETIDTGAGGVQVESAHSTVADSTNAHVVWKAGEPASELGTSIETANLGLPVEPGDQVTVNYQLLNEADPAFESVRLFIYDTAGADTFNDGPTQFVVAPDDGSINGTLTINIDTTGTIGSAGLVYDTSNGGVEGTVRFSDLRVAGQLVMFQPTPTEEPTEEPTKEPTEEPTETKSPAPGKGGGDDDDDKPGLPVTGSALPILGGLGAGALALGSGAVWLARRRRVFTG